MSVLPKPYPDEVVGSVVARACRHTGLPMRRLLRGIFESQRSSCSFLLGDNFARLAHRAGLVPQEFLAKHTMFPYTVAFMTSEIREQLTSKALALRPRGDSLSSLTKNVSHGVSYRRVCKQCIADDLKQFGESYWHREHLLPGVIVCRNHGKPLFETSIELRGRAHLSDVVLPHEARHLRPASMLPWELSARIAEISSAALNEGLPRKDNWLSFYRERAKSSGYLLPSGDIASGLVAYTLKGRFGAKYLLATGCPVADDPRKTWPALMVRPGSEANFATPKHVLMQVFLESKDQQPADRSTVYRTPGKRTRDYGLMDTSTATKLRMLLQQLALAQERVTIQALLRDAGAWSAYKHQRTKFIKTAALLEEFKQSDWSERQVGGRPYWRKRLPRRYSAADTDVRTPEPRDTPET